MKINSVYNELLYEQNRLSICYPKSELSTVQKIIDALGVVDKSKEYDLSIKQHTEKRSKNANDYSWVLTGKIADKLGMTKDECHQLMLRRYGQTAVDSHGNAIIVSALAVIPEEDIVKQCGYVAPIPTHGFVGGKEFIHYRVLKGSSEFDTHEMSVFIDGIVSECKELGIETLTPRELESMKGAWDSSK